MLRVEKAIEICFIETKEKYLSFGDFKFLLHKKGKLKRYPKKKKEKYKRWEYEFQLNSNTPKIPFRSYSWKPNYFSQIFKKMKRDGIIKQVIDNKSPVHKNYYLPNQPNQRDIFRSKHLAIINNIHDNEIGGSIDVAYYGLPRWAVDYPLKTFHRLEKISNKLRKESNKFWDIVCEMTEIKLKEIFKKIKTGNFSDKDKKLAFLYIDQVLTSYKKIDFHKLLYYNIIETTEFKWTGDGNSLSYLPNNYVLDYKISKLLLEFQEKKLFFKNKLIVIEPIPDSEHHYKLALSLRDIVKEIRENLN